MTDPDLRERRGSHRARRSALTAVKPAFLALGAVAALVVAVIVANGADPADVATAVTPGSLPSAGSTPAATAAAVPATAVPPTAVPPAAGPSTDGAAPSGAGAPPTAAAPSPAKPAPAHTPRPTSTPATSAAQPAPGGGGKAQRSAQVVVLNQTGVRGLAGRVAADLSNAGWRVSGTGNFRGSVPVTTVYYPAGMADAAAAVAADISGRDRVKPRFGNLSTTRLTVVLADVPA